MAYKGFIKARERIKFHEKLSAFIAFQSILLGASETETHLGPGLSFAYRRWSGKKKKTISGGHCQLRWRNDQSSTDWYSVPALSHETIR